MHTKLEQLILKTTNAKGIDQYQQIQRLWSGYGEILRVELTGCPVPSIILKYISIPDDIDHPRGWNTSHSHARKLQSYEIEMAWYRQWQVHCDKHCRTAHCYGISSGDHEHAIVLEDLDASGFSRRKSRLNLEEITPCLDWLANFHARFMQVRPDELWPTGSYWHLATRSEELAAMGNQALKQAATTIDRKLNNSPYQTIIHGDAKVANFCFSDDGHVAAVDFQYVGGGCGMKDLAYLLGSCLSEDECEQWQDRILTYYFSHLKHALAVHHPNLNADAIETDWRTLYPYAWTDFHRFLDGWSPAHHKLTTFSQRMVQHVLNDLEGAPTS